ncbi:MAG: c-type cytochrome [Gammaproteobacteria bacterium]
MEKFFHMNYKWRGIATGSLLLGGVLTGMPVSSLADKEPTPYMVECEADAKSGENCTVDKKTFVGWRMYHAFCHVCHAQNAVGSTFAPSLVDRLQDIDKQRFLAAVADGYTGQIGVMPGWKENPNISKNYEELYAYLKARSDGKLPPGRPKKQKKQ